MFEDDDDYDLGGVRWQASQAPNPALRKLISDSNNAVLNSPPILTPNSRNSEPYFPDSSSSYTRPTTGASTSTSTAKARRRAKATHPPAQSTSVASVLDLPSVDLINMFKGVSRKADENMHAKAQAQQAYAGAATHRVGLKQRSTLAMGSVGRPRPASVVGSIKGKERDYDREPLQARRVSMSAMVSPTDPTTSTGNKKTKRSPLSRSVSSSGSGSSPGASFFAPESRNTTPDTPFGLAESHSMEMDIDTPRFSSDDADLMPPPPLPVSKRPTRVGAQKHESEPVGRGGKGKLPALNVAAACSSSTSKPHASSSTTRVKREDTFELAASAATSTTPQLRMHPILEARAKRKSEAAVAPVVNRSVNKTKAKPASVEVEVDPVTRPSQSQPPPQTQARAGPPALGMRRAYSADVATSSQTRLKQPFKPPGGGQRRADTAVATAGVATRSAPAQGKPKTATTALDGRAKSKDHASPAPPEKTRQKAVSDAEPSSDDAFSRSFDMDELEQVMRAYD